MKREVAQNILNLSRESYNAMSVEFSRTRATFWEELSFLAEHATPGMRALDIGCGNGRFYPLLKERQAVYTGLDNSTGLLGEARKAHPEADFVDGDATTLPFPDSTFDIAFSFATIHHIPSRELRTAFIREAARVLKRGSTFVLTAWDLRQAKHFGKFMLSLIPFTKFERGDMMLTFGNKKHQRYLHAFGEKELLKLLRTNGFEVIGMEVIARKSGQKNFVVVAKKK